jgi:hypothetical protein
LLRSEFAEDASPARSKRIGYLLAVNRTERNSTERKSEVKLMTLWALTQGFVRYQ